MWLPDGRSSTGLRRVGGNGRGRRSVLLALVSAAAATSLLAGCGDGGFRPMYAASAVGGSTNEKLAQVDVGLIPGRVGQRIRNELIFQNTGGGTPLPPKYKLEIAIRESLTTTLVRLDGESSGQVYNLDAVFRLVRLDSKQVVMEGASYGRAGFERFQPIYSNVRAKEDAENRAARTVANEIKTRLAAYLSGAA
jgi:LPS-assembly lipoprotein